MKYEAIQQMFKEKSYHISEEKSWMRQLEMFEQCVELHAIEVTPRTVEVFSGFSLLTAVVVV